MFEKMTPQEKRYHFIYSVMRKHKISLATVSQFLNDREDEVANLCKIFDREGNNDEVSIRKRMVLLWMLSGDNREENLAYYDGCYIPSARMIAESDCEKYKVLIAAGLINNIEFYVRSCNWVGLVRYHAEKQSEETHGKQLRDDIKKSSEDLKKYAVGRQKNKNK